MAALQSQRGYDILVAAHVVAAVVGFLSVALSGIYGGTAAGNPSAGSGGSGNRPSAGSGGSGGSGVISEEVRRYFSYRGRSELLVAVVPFLGAAALVVEPGGPSFARAWVIIALALWVVAAVVLFVGVRPSEGVLRLAVATNGDAALSLEACEDIRGAGRRLKWSAAASDVIFFIALVVMVVKPGA